MGRAKRTRLKNGDQVKAVGWTVPARWRDRIGTIRGIRGADRTWTVIFSNRKQDWMVFYRDELEKILDS